MKKILPSILSIFVSSAAFADAQFKDGTIKEIYYHHRDTSPYVGVVVQGGTWVSNSCGTTVNATNIFIVDPAKLPPALFSMLLSAQATKSTVELGSYGANPSCYAPGQPYPVLNFVRIVQ